jgi:ectoine hydroxylase-related dioxygenase (phytanoyl-CoA dioxygenase family)
MSAISSAELTAVLLENGYCIVPDLVERASIEALDQDLDPVFAATPFGQGDFYGYRTRRFGALLKRSSQAQRLALEKTILGAVKAILGDACDTIQIHPGEVRQFPHRDHDMWNGAKGAHEYLVNVIWPLTPFRAENGATQIYPHSHGAAGMARQDPGKPVIAQCDPGSAICFLGSTAHGAGANLTASVRRAVVIGYSLGWLKPYENLWLAYPPAIARTFPPELAALVGYVQHRPNLGNFEGQCPSVVLRDDIDEHLAAMDALRPDQAAMVADFAAQERLAR